MLPSIETPKRMLFMLLKQLFSDLWTHKVICHWKCRTDELGKKKHQNSKHQEENEKSTHEQSNMQERHLSTYALMFSINNLCCFGAENHVQIQKTFRYNVCFLNRQEMYGNSFDNLKTNSKEIISIMKSDIEQEQCKGWTTA